MNRRPAVTLMEVLIAMFIMAVGMMALLVLFPVGAVSMAQALKDDRSAYASTVSENVAIAMNVRYGDPVVNGSVASPTGFFSPLALLTGLVYVDPYAAQYVPIQPGLATLGGLIPRVAPTFASTQPAIDRWFSLQDDVNFNQSGTPDTSYTAGNNIDRGRRYTYAYLLRRQPALLLSNNPFPNSMYSVQLYAVVYNGRPVNSLATTQTEWPWPLVAPVVPATANTNSILLNGVGTTIRRGGWILDPANGVFYRVTNYTELGTTTTVELQQNLIGVLPITQIVVMDYVAEVFDKGVGWQQ